MPWRPRLGELEVEVDPDEVVRQPGKTNFAGSALRPIDGILRAAQMLKWPWQSCWSYLSLAPAHFVGVESGFEVGAPATFCCIKPNDNALEVEWCWNGALSWQQS